MLKTLKTISKTPSKPLVAKKAKRSPSENLFKANKPFELECGESLENLEVSYSTYGELNADKSNVVWVCHALTANAKPKEWWPGLVGEKDLFNPDDYFIVCANIIGSAYGSTSPLNCELEKGFRNFPLITVNDVVRAWKLLRNHLSIKRIQTLIGGSLGGHQALEWAIEEPEIFENLILCATSAQSTPWVTAFNESQRLAIEADKSFYHDTPTSGANGLKAARSIALLSYRNNYTYNSTQSDVFDLNRSLKSTTYQSYQGDKLVKRFNAYSYHGLTKTMDSHDVGRNRGGIKQALSKVKAKTLVIGINTDILFPVSDSKVIADGIKGSEFITIDSTYGHDGFLIETKKISKIISEFYTKEKQISLFGLGCVGQGFYKLMGRHKKTSQINSIYVKNVDKDRGEVIHSEVLNSNDYKNKDLDKTIVEVTDDYQLAEELLDIAIEENKTLITANKKMVATHLDKIIENQKSGDFNILYESSVAGSIPVIRNLDRYFTADGNQSLKAIINGSSNFILTQIFEQKWSYEQSLDRAKELGFAETDPYSDVSGEDAKFKSVILAAHAFGKVFKPDEILCLGIQNINKAGIDFAKEHDYEIKQVATLKRLNEDELSVYVSSHFVHKNNELALTKNENNLIQIKSNDTDYLFKGAGAGSVATGSAVISDVVANEKGERYSYEIDDSQVLNYEDKTQVFVSNNIENQIPFLGRVLIDSANYQIVETAFDKLKSHEDELQKYHFVCEIPDDYKF